MSGAANGIWQKIALGLLTILVSFGLAWSEGISSDNDEQDLQLAELAARVAVAEENVRNIHHEQAIDRGILNRIDKNTGGKGNAPPVRELREVR